MKDAWRAAFRLPPASASGRCASRDAFERILRCGLVIAKQAVRSIRGGSQLPRDSGNAFEREDARFPVVFMLITVQPSF